MTRKQPGDRPRAARSSPAAPEAISVGEALDALQAAIGDELSTGQISEEAAAKLQEAAGKVLEKYQEGDLEKLVEEFDKLMEELDKVTEEGEIASVEAYDRIEAAIADLELAIENDPPVSSDDGKGEGDD
jgi:hypothetical protein